MPETRSVVATVNRLGESAVSLGQAAATLPESFSKEREATIQQLLTGMEQQQGTMRQLLVEVRQSLEAGHGASDSLQGVLDRADAVLRRLKVGEPPPPGGRPFDITEYTQAVATLGDTTKQVQTLVSTLEHDAATATRLGDAMRGHAERVIDHLYKRVIQALGVLLVAVLLTRARLAATRSAFGTAGCKTKLCGGRGALVPPLWVKEIHFVRSCEIKERPLSKITSPKAPKTSPPQGKMNRVLVNNIQTLLANREAEERQADFSRESFFFFFCTCQFSAHGLPLISHGPELRSSIQPS